MNVETVIKLNRFQPRGYQLALCHALETHKYKRLIAIWPRRAGKDIVAFNLMLRAALRKIGVYYYIFPTYAQAKKVIWDSITNDGQKFIDFIPRELVKSSNSQEMKIQLINGSLIQLVGSDNVDSLVGTNPCGCVFSEYALQDPRAYQFIRPILLVNDGWALFVSTPRGKNNLWELYNIAEQSDAWFCQKLTVEDTGHISLADIEKEKQEGIMSDDLIQQEYFTSFEMGVEGAFYAKYLDRMRLNNQIGNVPWEPSFAVHTAWDIGVRDSTSIIFFQTIGQTVRIIDCYEKAKEGLEHYVNIIKNKPYTYGKHIAPHDIAVKEWGSGMTRIEKAKHLGLKFVTAPNISIMDGIESVRSCLPKCWIDEVNCKELIKALENYRQEYDQKKKVYMSTPLHNQFSHMADAARYLAISLPKTRDGLSAEELDARYRKAMLGDQAEIPEMFRDTHQNW